MKWTEADLAERGLRVSTDPLERARLLETEPFRSARKEAAEKLSGLREAVYGKPNKYRAHKRAGPNFMGGERLYASAWQSEVARQLRDEMAAGQIASVEPEVSFIVGYTDDGKAIRHIVDFLVRDDEGKSRIVEAKGYETPTGRAKRGVLTARGWAVQVRVKPRKARKVRR